MRYLIVIGKEPGSQNYSSYAPDVLGCIAVGDTFEECKMSMQEALEFHLEGDESLPVPHASPDDPEIVNNPNLTPIYIDITIPHRAA
jgi:predicted RNase H-like HicB family nuclease